MPVNRNATRAGRAYQRSLTKYFRELGVDAEDLTLAGTEDEGDLVLRRDKTAFVIEAKRTKAFAPADWIKQAVAEAANWNKHRDYRWTAIPVVIAHARQKGIEDAYVLMRVRDFTRLL